MKFFGFFKLFLPFVCLTVPIICKAHFGIFPHPNPGQSFLNGVLHPITGLDHLLIFLGMGIWTSLQVPKTVRARFLMPACIGLAMVTGGCLGVWGFSFAFLEIALSLTVLAVGILIVMQTDGVGYFLVFPFFALAHGLAHGLEAPGSASNLSLFFTGMLMSSISIFYLGRLLSLRPIGWAISASGLILFFMQIF